MHGLKFVPAQLIISYSSSNNYTEFFLKDKKGMLVSRTLKETEEILSNHSFLRVDNSHIVTLNTVTKYLKGEGDYLVMQDGSTVVFRSRVKLLMKKLQPFKE